MEHEWVDLDGMPGVKLDVRYATPDNFFGKVVYSAPKVFLQKPVVESLLQAARMVERAGFGLLVFDGYRPWSVTKLFWEGVEPEIRKFLADPVGGSAHNRGCAVDLSLFELGSGREVEMPSGFDEMTERAYRDYPGGSSRSRELRDLLRSAMEEAGFTGIPLEWWHYNHPDRAKYPIADLTFEEIACGLARRDLFKV